MNNVLMECGCVATAESDGKPVCAVHFGHSEEDNRRATTPAKEQPNLEGRKARCPYCRKIKDSDLNLPMFSYHPDWDFDQFYDGCFGWD